MPGAETVRPHRLCSPAGSPGKSGRSPVTVPGLRSVLSLHPAWGDAAPGGARI